MQSASRFRSFCLIFTRFVAALCLTLWIGGLAFFGIMAAPVLFHPEKSGIPRAPDTATTAPQMVSAMLTRFGTLTTLCAILLLCCILTDGALSRAAKSWLWRVQAALGLICLGFALFLNRALLPQTTRDQSQILPLIARAARGELLSVEEARRRAAFDSGHTTYQRLSSFNLYLLLAILWLLVARGTQVSTSLIPKSAPKL